jgi:hypothetical protein
VSIIPFDFEEQAVRVIMRGEDPWFVAADICRVLEHSNTSMALKGLDEDEVTLSQIEGNHRPTNLISESGLYALVLTSRKEAARRFRKWITAEVLPAIRRTGRYDLTPVREPEPAPDAGDEAMGPRDWLALIREARILGGTNAGRRMWSLSPLPPLNAATTKTARLAIDPEEGRACLDWLEGHLPVRLALTLLGDSGADDQLSPLGLRVVEEGLFVSNSAEIFNGTRWGGGVHYGALRALAGVEPGSTSRSLMNRQVRGLVVPFNLIGGQAHA